MTRIALRIALLDLRRTLRERETWFWTFGMPLAFFWFFSQMGGGPSGEKRERLRLDVPEDAGFLADVLEERLELRGYDVERADMGEGAPDRRLELPAGFTERALRGEHVEPVLHVEGSARAQEYDRFRAARAVYSLVADLAALAAEGRAVTPEAMEALASAPRTLTIAERPAGERRRIPSGAEQSIPGTLTMFTLIVLLTSGAIGIVVDRRSGLLRRLAAAPLSRGEVVLGRWLAILGLGLVQIAYGAAVGMFLFGVDWGPDIAVVAAVLLAWAAFGTSAALWLGTLARTEAQAVGVGVLSANVLAALGGCWWPIEVSPRWMQELATHLPTGWVMGALHELAIFQTGPASAVRAITLLVAGALVLAALAARRFRFE